MTKSVYLTVPVIADPNPKILVPTPEFMGLEDTTDTLLYGFHGSPNTKAAALNIAYNKSQEMGKKFYLVDLLFKAPESFDESTLMGSLHKDMLQKVPFLFTKRISRAAAVELGEMWYEWAVAAYGPKKVNAADVDWEESMSYIPAFPLLADRLFEVFPKLRCAVLPLRLMGATSSLTWVGVSLKGKAHRWVDAAEVRMQPEITVKLKF